MEMHEKIKAYIKQIANYCSVAFIRSDQSGGRYGDVFLSYKIISNTPEPDQCSFVTYTGIINDENKLKMIRAKEHEYTVSLTFMGPENKFGAVWAVVNKAYDFIDSITGFDAATALGIGVNAKGPIQDRTVLFETAYEYRLGFDIGIRIIEAFEEIIDTVDVIATINDILQ